jgi:hypothetical protein
MSQIIFTTLIVGYAGPYLVKYTAEKIAEKIFYKTTKAVKKKVTDVIYKNKDPIIIEYECINLDVSGNIIYEPITYVTSERLQLIDQSWADISRPESRTPGAEETRIGPSVSVGPPVTEKNHWKSKRPIIDV